MHPSRALSVALLMGFANSVLGLKCNEGFNMTVGGIPLYHWTERTCAANSKCFGQELQATYGVPVVMRYGACLSSAYASYLNCDELFGPTSTFDPAQLLDLIPDITKRFNDTIHDFVGNELEQLKILLSNGKGSIEFVEGVFKFYENLGFDMTKAEPLKEPLGNLLRDAFSGDPALINQRGVEVLNAIGNLDTANTEYTNAIYKFLGNLMSPAQVNALKSNPVAQPLIEKLPGLYRSMLPKSYNPALWYDVAFKLLSNLDLTNPKKTATDMVATIRTSYEIPDDVKKYTDPFFDRIPDLVDKLSQGNFDYAGNWSLELLKQYSEVDAATSAFSDALIGFLQNITRMPLQYEFKTTIQWIPGLFYKFAPDEKAKIQVVYRKISNGLRTFDFSNMSNTAQPTKLSELLINLVEKNTGTSLESPIRALIINFSRMFYDFLSDYSSYVEKFFQILNDGLASWPNINSGKLIGDLIKGMDGTVPKELEPLLTNLQPMLTEFMKISTHGFDATALFKTMNNTVDAYKKAFPDSPFPDVVQSYINGINGLVFFDRTQPNAFEKYNNLMIEIQLLQIDLQLAMIQATDYTKDELTQMLIKAFPAYETYIKVMRSLKAEDVKKLAYDIIGWARTGPYTPEGFVEAIKPTMEKITKSIKNLLGEIRKIFQPESCKYSACDTDLCNTHVYIAKQQPLTKAPAIQPTSGSDQIGSNVLLNVAVLWIACKAVLG